MKNIIKKSISLLLVIFVLFGSAPLAGFVGLELPEFNLFGTKAEAATSGTCGDNLTWTLDETIGELVISGTGAMSDYEYNSYAPWYNSRSSIKSVTFSSGVTSIGDHTFYKCTSLTNVTIPDGVTSIGDYAFYGCDSLTSVTIPDGVTSIDAYAFDGCTSLTSIVIGNSVTSIGNYAFDGCTSLASVTIGNSVTSIGERAFRECTSLTSIIIPDSVTSLGVAAFNNCGLTSITIGNNVTSISDGTFYYCENLKSVKIPDSITSIGEAAFYRCVNIATTYYTGTPEKWSNISIGSSNDAISKNIVFECDSERAYYSIGTCGDNLTWTLYADGELVIDGMGDMSDYSSSSNAPWYSKRAAINSVTIGNSVTNIGDYAFYDCTGLTSITIPDSVTNIGSHAFYNCTGLTSLTIPDSVTNIGSYAFHNCENLETITFGNGIIKIGFAAFSYCNNITRANYPGTPEQWQNIAEDSYIDNGIVFECNSERPYYYGTCGANLNWKLYTDGELVISGSGEMYDYDASNSYDRSPWQKEADGKNIVIKTASISNGVTSIGDDAFYSCSDLISITIPETVTDIGFGAFASCDSLTNVFYSGDLADWCKINFGNNGYASSNPLRYGINLYINGLLLEGNIVIPETVSVINNYAFDSCDSITSVTIPTSVASIGYRAFYGCSNIETTYYCGTYAEWQNITIGLDNDCLTKNIVYEYGTDNVNYGSGSCGSDLTWKIDLDGTLIIEGSGIIPNYSESSTPWYAVRDKIKNVVIPEGVTNIGASAFGGCTNIKKFIVDENNVAFVSDEYGVLYNKDITKLIKYPAKSEYTEYTIPESVESIRLKAFEQAKNLRSVTLNTGITEIGESAFDGCSNIVQANYYGTQAEWNNITVGATNECLTNKLIFEYGTDTANYGGGSCGNNLTWVLYYDGSLIISGTGAMTNFATANPAPWSGFRSKITSISLPSGMTHIGNSAFAYCTNVEDVEIPSSVTSIGELAFAECDKIKAVSVPYGVKTVGADAFRDCDALESVVFPDSVTSIGNSAFYMCDSLKNVTLSKNITLIDDYMFYKCISLENVVIPDKVTSVDNYAFYGCANLKELTIPVTAKMYNSSYVFGGCTEIDKITLTKGTTGIMLDYGTSTSSSSSTLNYKYAPWYISGCSEIVVGEGVKNISEYAFYYCGSLKNLTLPGSIEGMGYMAFYNCNAIENIYYTGSLADWCKIIVDNTHPVNYTDNLYINGKLIEGELVIPDGVTSIRDMAFGELDNITNVIIPDSVTSIGKNAFGGCEGIVSVDIGDGVTSIGEYAFVECSGITTLVIGNNVTNIGNGAFMGCAELRELTMPVTAKIYNSADTFYGCDKLEKVTLTKGTTGIMQDYGTSSSETATLTHCCNTPWYMSDSCTEVIIEEGVKNIGDNAFRSCKNIKNIRIPSSVTSIGDNAFRMCYGLEKVTIPDAVTSIGDGAFYYCDGIKELTMPVSAKIYNSSNTFYNCTGIDKIIFTKGTGTMPDYGTSTSTSSATTYYQYTPWYISGCSEIFLPNGVSTIGMYAFHECGNLTTVNFEGSSDEYSEILIKDYNNPLIFAKVNFVSYTVKWVCGNETKQETVRVGATIVSPTFESVEGYSIVGWSPEIPDAMPSENLTFTAVLEAKSYNVEWDANGTTTEEIYKYGQVINKPSDPEKEGYTFIGWTPEVPDVMPSSDLTFTAVYTANNYDAVFDANGGAWADGAIERTETVAFDSEIVAPEAPSKSGYIFSGWSFEEINLGTELGVMDDVNGKVFKAVWIASTDTVYTVETYIMNTAGEYEKSVQIFTGETDSTVTAEYTVEEGFTFSEEMSAISGVVAADNSLVLKVYMDRNTYTFTTIVDGVSTETEYFYGSIIAEPVAPSKAGYTFVDWDNQIPATMPANNVTATAIFEVNSYNAIFNANGGKWSDGASTKAVATDFESEIVAPSNPTRQGYDFAGWDSEIGIMDNVNGKMFNAKWTARNDTKYTIEIYTMNTDGKYSVSKETQKGTTDTEVSVTANVSTGFALNSVKSVLSGKVAANGSLVLKIYYDRNKYTFTTSIDGKDVSKDYYFDASISKPENPVKAGYKFTGWDKQIPSKMPANDITVIAIFEKLSLEMSIRNPSTTTISYGDKIILHADMNEALPSGWKIKWTADNGNFSYSASSDGTTCTISPSKSGDTTFTTTVYDENGNVVSEDTQKMTSKAGFFDKIIAFFRGLFGGNKVIAQAFKGIF